MFFQSRQNNEIEQCVNYRAHILYIFLVYKMYGLPNPLNDSFSSSLIGGQYVGMCVFHKPSCKPHWAYWLPHPGVVVCAVT